MWLGSQVKRYLMYQNTDDNTVGDIDEDINDDTDDNTDDDTDTCDQERR